MSGIIGIGARYLRGSKTQKGPNMEKQQEAIETGQQEIDGFTGWLTPGQAAIILARNSGRDETNPDVIRSLADLVKKLGQKKVIRSKKLNSRMNLYHSEDVQNYTVEERGKKAGRAARARAKSS
jgi:hypothetical protein